MTPDLERLCDAAGNVELDMYPDYLRDEEAEKVVRAVLIALREPGEAARIAALNTGLPGMGDPPLYEKVWLNMVDAILGEPATA